MKPNTMRSDFIPANTLNVSNLTTFTPTNPAPGNSSNPFASNQQNSSSHIYQDKMLNNFTAEKGGMQGIDKERIAKIIDEATKNTRHYKKDEEDNKRFQAEAEVHKKDIEKLHKNKELFANFKAEADSIISRAKANIDLTKIWLHLDMDMFFAAVEIRDDPSLANIPIAVGDMSMISTSNYIARQYGVRSAMPGFIAIKLCPQLKFVKLNFNKYRYEGNKVYNVLTEYDPEPERMGCDEAYCDLTNYCTEHNISTDEELKNLADEIKKKVYNETHLTCSIGISINKTLAKICSDVNKPDGYFRLEPDPDKIFDFTKKLSLRKIPFVGAKSEKRYKLLGINTVEDYFTNYVEMCYLWKDSFEFIVGQCLGVGHNKHSVTEPEKSISRGRSFYMTGDKVIISTTFNHCVNKVFQDMDKINITTNMTKTISVSITPFDERKRSKNFTKKNGFLCKEDMRMKFNELLDEILVENGGKARYVCARVSGFVREDNGDIVEWIMNLQKDVQNNIVPLKEKREEKCKENFNENTKCKPKSNNNLSKKRERKRRKSMPCMDIEKLFMRMQKDFQTKNKEN